MAGDIHELRDGFARRDLMGIGAATLAMTLVAATDSDAQTGPGPQPPAAKPGNVLLEKRDAVLLIGINRPEARNLLDPPILVGLGKALYQLEHDASLRVAVMHGVGRDFSVGVDLPAVVAALAAGELPPKDPDFIGPFGFAPPYRSKPVVVAVHGATRLGGHELFLAADIRVAAADTVFSQNEIARGGFPSGGATVRFTREAGWANAMRYMLTGDEWGAEEAHRLGLVQEAVPAGKQLDRAIELTQKIAAGAPLGVQATLASSRQALPAEEATAYAALTPERARIAQSEDAKEGRRALQERRPPVFSGR
jgi:enoyl-CoA hydratase/carnithine racemase